MADHQWFNLALRVSPGDEAAGRRPWEDHAARELVRLVRLEGYEVIDGAVTFEWRKIAPEADCWTLFLRARVAPAGSLG
jgi:hypothetical protein